MPKYASSIEVVVEPDEVRVRRLGSGARRRRRLAGSVRPGTVWPNWPPSLCVTVLNDVMMGSVSVEGTVTITKPLMFCCWKRLSTTSGAYRVAPGWMVAVAVGGVAPGVPRLRNSRVTSTGV